MPRSSTTSYGPATRGTKRPSRTRHSTGEPAAGHCSPNLGLQSPARNEGQPLRRQGVQRLTTDSSYSR